MPTPKKPKPAPNSDPVSFTLTHKSLFAEAPEQAVTVKTTVEGLLDSPHLRKAIGNAFMSAIMIALDKAALSGLTTQVDLDFGDLAEPGLSWLRDRATTNSLEVARNSFKRDAKYRNVRLSQSGLRDRFVVGPKTEKVK